MNFFRQYIVLFVIVLSQCCFFYNAKGQQINTAFKHLSTTEGLSNFTVYSIAQDHQGFMWFGTMDGLNRYDGKEIKTYREDPDDQNSLGNNVINALQVSGDSGIWVGTYQGLYYYNFHFDNFQHIPLLPNEGTARQYHMIRAFLVVEDHMWIATSLGLFRYDFARNQIENFSDQLSPQGGNFTSVFALELAEEGTIWIGHAGLSKYKNNEFEHVPIDTEAVVPNSVISLEIDDFGRLWVGTSNLQYGLIIYDPDKQSSITLSRTEGHVPHNRINCLHKFDDGNMWVGTTWGLAIINQETLKSQLLYYDKQDPRSISQNSIKQIYRSKNGIIWLGTYSGGINYFDPRSQRIRHVSDKYDQEKSISFNIVSSIFEDDHKKLWIGTEYGGVNVLQSDNDRIEVFRRKYGDSKSLISDNVKSFAQDYKGRLFIATQFGLSIFDPVNSSFFNIDSQMGARGKTSADIVHDVCRDEFGDIWIGTTGNRGRFQKYDVQKDTIIHYHPDDRSFPTLNSVVVNSLFYDKFHSIMWAGGNNGLAGFNVNEQSYVIDERFRPLAEKLQNTVINDLYVDDHGLLWIATFGRGLYVLDIDSFSLRKIGKDEGISESSFYGITGDNNGNIWISLSAHILKIKGPGSIDEKITSVYQFGLQEGFPPQQYIRNSAFTGSDGTLYFGGDDGYIAFDPAEVEKIVIHPKVVITDVLVNGEPLQIDSKADGKSLHVASQDFIELKYKQSSFALHFIAPNFINPDNIWYQYQLSGLHDTWQDLGKSNTINFTNLKAGKYKIRLRASSDPNSFAEQYAQFGLSVEAAPWATPFAFALYVITFLILLYVFYLISRRWERMTQKLKMEHNEREQENIFHQRRIKFFTDISHELRTPLTLILAPIDRLIKSNLGNAQIKNQLMLMLRNGERMLQLINQLLDLRKLETGHMQLQVAKGNVSLFVNEVSLSFKELAESKAIKFQYSSQPEKINLWFDRDKFEIILFNLLSNAIKFTPKGGLISVSVTENGSEILKQNGKANFVNVEVSNTGKGIPEDEIKHVFERFYTGDASLAQKNFGSGVGLEIVEKLVGLHHGSISVHSKYDTTGEDGSTTFVISLPKGKNHFEKSQLIKGFKNSEDISNYGVLIGDDSFAVNESELLEQNRKGEYDHSLLIVEDNADVRSLIVEIFCQEYKVYIAEDGRKGLDIARKMIPDLIISDVMMPEMDGIELCRRLKGDVVTSHIPVILLTARTAVTFKYEGLETGADDYIVKPFNVEDLKLRTSNLIRQRQLLKEKFTQDGSFIPSDITTTSVDEKFMGKVRDYIIENIGTDRLTVEKIAEETGMSRANFYRKIKVLTNMSAAEFLKKIKMDHAAQLLKTNRFRVSEVQSIIGITDGDYFRKCFKTQFGMAPKDYVNEYSE